MRRVANGDRVTYEYDSLDRITKKTTEHERNTAYTFTEEYEYYVDGKDANKTSTRVTDVVYKCNGERLLGLKYRYDENGNIAEVVDYPDFGYSIAYSYDSKNQVKIEQHNGTGVNNRIYYIYDESGNILKKKDKEYEYTDSRWGDLLTSYDGHTITYNDAGYPTQYPVKGVDSRLEWTYNGRLSAVFPSNGGVYDYLYDSFGRRVAKNTNGSKFYYSGDTLVAETRAQGKYFEYMYDESGRPQGMYYYDGTKLNKYYFLLNLQGDVVQLRAQNNSLIAEYIYSAYGEILSIKDANGNDITDSNHIANVNPIRYRGYYYDTETGFYYLKSRYYDPNTGRFLSPDSQFNGGLLGYNLYAYCENNPVGMADPDGHVPQWMKDAANWVNNSIIQPVANFFSPSTNTISGQFQEGIWQGSGSLTGGYSDIMVRGQTNKQTFPFEKESTTTFGVFGKISGGNASGKVGIGNSDLSISAKGVGDVLTATGQAGLTYKDGLGVKLKAKAAVATGRATIEFNIFGCQVEFGAYGDALSIGAEATIGYFEDGFEASVGASALFGGGVILRVKPAK